MNHFICSWLQHSTHTKPYNKYDLQLGLVGRGETRQLLSRGEGNEWEHGISLTLEGIGQCFFLISCHHQTTIIQLYYAELC